MASRKRSSLPANKACFLPRTAVMQRKRPIRIGDNKESIARFAASYPDDPVDVIIGDWLSEANMTALAARKAAKDGRGVFEWSFVEAIRPALDNIQKYGIKVAVNAGGSDTELLHKTLTDLIAQRGLTLKVAWVSGDELPLSSLSSSLTNIYTNDSLGAWPFKPLYAQAYLGGFGIASAFAEGADIVVCGRVSDASPVIGAAAWWHGWWDKTKHQDQLANAFVAGHLIECSTYVTAGNFAGFVDLEDKWHDLGFPIAEIGENGQVVITKQQGTGGVVNIDTCKAQLLYEIQGPWYFNSDVTAVLNDISFVQVGPDRVALQGVKSSPPPPTTKVGITALGGYQAEVQWYLVGLDIPTKARHFEQLARKALGSNGTLERLKRLEFQQLGVAQPDAASQNASTVLLRVVAQAQNLEALSPGIFLKPILDLIMSSYPGGTFNLDLRQGFPKPIYEYYVTLLPQEYIEHQVHLPFASKVLSIPPPTMTKVYPRRQPSQSITQAQSKTPWGKTTKAPLGSIVLARSGDKGSDSNVGFWVRSQEEFEWLRGLLSTEKLKELLGQEYNGKEIDRFELPKIWAVHFLLHDHLDRGVSCTTTVDFLGKNVAEFLRARHVDIPVKFLDKTRSVRSKM
ncbi:DUF1446 domain protein [Flagelloscypha sp. PMI_526]|nr:DUF1446 domain protein [Flagelloscypha sp. PMI_526]